jgi:poly(beta-D-mannuronate) lyase
VTYGGNILWGSAAPGDIPAIGFWRIAPQLALATATNDIEGQPRAVPDVGADGLSPAPALRHPLTPADVGPSAR